MAYPTVEAEMINYVQIERAGFSTEVIPKKKKQHYKIGCGASTEKKDLVFENKKTKELITWRKKTLHL